MARQKAALLHVQLKLKADGETVELRYFGENPNEYQSKLLKLDEIGSLIQRAERDYYVSLPEAHAKTGQILFAWLDGSDRFLSQQLQRQQQRGQVLVLAIATDARLSHLPWEILHDGKDFLVAQSRIPIRWQGTQAALIQTDSRQAPKRPLQLLFMATAPEGAEPPLAFEDEEAAILEATRKPSILLEVEESGCLEELGYLVDEYSAQDGFDIFHLTGHATIQTIAQRSSSDTADGEVLKVPVFLTESETGETLYSPAKDLYEPIRLAQLPLIFLSGCRTGQGSDQGEIPSMAEGLLEEGAQAVLAWGQKVRDGDATLAAAMLYDRLAAGYTLAEALAETYRALLEGAAQGQVRDWHLLRLFVGDRLPGALIQRSRKRVRYREAQAEFLDDRGEIKVVGRTGFVGRRRELQGALRHLAPDAEALGVMFYGMGGLGKSALAARVCDRLTRLYDRLVWVGTLDRNALVNKLAEKLGTETERQALRDEQTVLKYRLRRALEAMLDADEAKPLLLVLDDFEQNLEPVTGAVAGTDEASFVCSTEAASVFQALAWALQEVGAHRLLITCRYNFKLSCLRGLESVALAPFAKADEEKKARRLKGLVVERGASDPASDETSVQRRARVVADGNPRLMEWLDKLLRNDSVDSEILLTALEAEGETEQKAELQEQVLAKVLLNLVDGEMRAFLQSARIFDLAVPREVLVEVCVGAERIDQALALGLLERYPDGAMRVPRVLPLGQDWGEVEYERAAAVLYRVLCEESESPSEVQQLEIHRLALAGRFEAMSLMLGTMLAKFWVNICRYSEAESLCKKTLSVTDSYLVWHQLARSQHFTKSREAIVNYEKALHKAAQVEGTESKEILQITHNRAILLAQFGETDKALTIYQRLYAIGKESNDFEAMIATLGHMAQIYQRQGQIEKALTNYQAAQKICEQIGDYYYGAINLHNMADLYDQKGDLDTALKLYEESLEIQEKAGKSQVNPATLHQMAMIYEQREEIEKALSLYQQSLKMQEEIGDIKTQADTLHQLANIYKKQEEIEKALSLYQQSLKMQEEIGAIDSQATTLHQIANIYAEQDAEKALAFYQKSLDISDKTGNLHSKAMTLSMMAQVIILARGDFDAAISYSQESIGIFEKIESSVAEKAQRVLDYIACQKILASPRAHQFQQAIKEDDQVTLKQLIHDAKLSSE